MDSPATESSSKRPSLQVARRENTILFCNIYMKYIDKM